VTVRAARQNPFPLLAVVLIAACRSAPSNAIQGTGTLELTEVDVSPLIPARVTKVYRQEGDRIRVGDTLITLTQPALPSDIAAQRSAVATTEAQLRDLQAGPRPAEVDQAEAALRAAEAEAQRTAEDLARIAPLAGHGTVSQQQGDAARAAARSAASRRDEAREQLRLVREGARPQTIAAARAQVGSAKASLSGIERTARDLILTASVSGTVLSRHVEPGEVLSPGVSGMTIGDETRPYVRIYLNQVAFPQVHIGDSASVVLDAMPDHPFKGTVVALADRAEFTPRVALTRDERADLMFGVKVQLVDPTTTLKAGLPVTVTILPGTKR
jgi:HlyD family secretion protein